MMTTIHRDSPSAAHPSGVVTRAHQNRPLLNSYQLMNPSKAIAWEMVLAAVTGVGATVPMPRGLPR